MASWTDKTPEFNPYIQQLPVEDMVKVGMQKQAQYDEGVKKIQTNIDNVAGMDVIRGIDKTYLQSKINELGNNLKFVAAGDFSNFQLVNSVTGMTNQISKDKNVLNAVSSTQKYRKELNHIEEQRKKGLVTPDNLYNFQKGANQWLNSEELDSSFNASYKDHFDVMKFARETFDDIKPENYSFDEIYTKDANGNLTLTPTMRKKSVEGLLPQKVQTVVNQIMSDPRVNQQLAITGEYQYRGYDSEQLSKLLDVSQQVTEENINFQIDKLKIKQSSGEDVTDQLDALTDRLQKVKNNFDSNRMSAYENPDLIRGMLYKEKTEQNYNQMFSYKKEVNHVLSNPEWEGRFKLQQRAIDNQKWQMEFGLKQDKLELDKLKRLDELREKNIESPGIPFQNFFEGQEPSNIEKLEFSDLRYTQDSGNYQNASNEILYETLIKNSPELYKKRSELISRNVSLEDANEILIKEYASKNNIDINDKSAYSAWRTAQLKNFTDTYNSNENKSNTDIDLYKKYRNSKSAFEYSSDVKNEKDKSFQTQLVQSGVLEKANDLNSISFQKEDGGSNTFTPEDIVLFKLFLLKDDWDWTNSVDEVKNNASSLAYQNLTSKFGKDFIDELYKEQSLSENYRTGTSSGTKRKARLMEEVNKLDNNIENINYESLFENQVNIVDNAYGKDPNLSFGLYSGVAKKDIPNLGNLTAMVNSFTLENEDVFNEAEDFDKFKTDILGSSNLIETGVTGDLITDGKNSYVKLTSKSGGTMVITDSMAKTLGIDKSLLFESTEIKMAKDKIKRSGSTSELSPNLLSTYQNDSYQWGNENFSFLNNQNDFNVKVNIERTSDGSYRPYVYVKYSDTETGLYEKVFNDLFVENNLTVLKNKLNSFLTPKNLINYVNTDKL